MSQMANAKHLLNPIYPHLKPVLVLRREDSLKTLINNQNTMVQLLTVLLKLKTTPYNEGC